MGLLARGWVAGWLCLAMGCAPVIRNFTFPREHPLYGKRIGIIYSPSGEPGSEGVDDHDLHEFLGALGKTLGTHVQNSEFVDLTANRAIGPFPRAGLPDTGFLGGITTGFYAVPDSQALSRLPDSLDCLLFISGLSFTGGSPVEDTLGAGHRSAAILEGIGFTGVAPIGAARIPGMPGMRPTLNLSGDDGPDATEGTAFRYLVWDRRARRPLAYSPLRMRQSKRFGAEGTSFGEDAERIGQKLLRELAKPMRAGRSSSEPDAIRRP